MSTIKYWTDNHSKIMGLHNIPKNHSFQSNIVLIKTCCPFLYFFNRLCFVTLYYYIYCVKKHSHPRDKKKLKNFFHYEPERRKVTNIVVQEKSWEQSFICNTMNSTNHNTTQYKKKENKTELTTMTTRQRLKQSINLDLQFEASVTPRATTHHGTPLLKQQQRTSKNTITVPTKTDNIPISQLHRSARKKTRWIWLADADIWLFF